MEMKICVTLGLGLTSRERKTILFFRIIFFCEMSQMKFAKENINGAGHREKNMRQFCEKFAFCSSKGMRKLQNFWRKMNNFHETIFP